LATLTSKYQLSLPKAVAKKAGLAPGDELECVVAGEVVRVRKKQPRVAALDDRSADTF
jgi:AbrB family looped-hinge helix DNA binding protein